MKYFIVCKHCGIILMKSDEPVLATLTVEIKCPNPNCKNLLQMPEDIKVIREERPKSRPGLDKWPGDN